MEKFLKQHPRVNRYLDLLDTAQAAKDKTLTLHAAGKLGPGAHFAGADRDLAELCIGRR